MYVSFLYLKDDEIFRRRRRENMIEESISSANNCLKISCVMGIDRRGGCYCCLFVTQNKECVYFQCVHTRKSNVEVKVKQEETKRKEKRTKKNVYYEEREKTREIILKGLRM